MNRLMVTRVQRGIELLDIKMPLWRDSVDWKKFDIDDEEKCVLGQIGHSNGNDYYGSESWLEVYQRLMPSSSPRWAWKFGFTLPYEQFTSPLYRWYRWQLNRVWRHYGPQGGALS